MKYKLALILVLLLIGSTGFAQNSMTVTGYVLDGSTPDLQPLEGQEVIFILDSTNTGYTFQDAVITDEQGYYTATVSAPIDVTHGIINISTFDSCFQSYTNVMIPFIPGFSGISIDFIECDTYVPPCEAGYDYFPADTNTGTLTYDFFDFSIGNPTSWLWTYDGITFSTEQNPTFTFPQAGIYTVCLAITDSTNNCTDKFCADITIGNPIPCIASFTYQPDPQEDYTIQFTNTSLGNDLLNFFWDFGDGNSSNEENPSHTFPDYGIYEVCLTIYSNDSLCFDTFCTDVLVQEVTCQAQFSYEPDPVNDLTIYFTDESTISTGGSPGIWLWDLGDGNISEEQNPVHTYAGEGNYEVCLFILDYTSGCSSLQCESIVVGDTSTTPLASSFIVSLDSLSGQPFLYHFTSTSTGDIGTWQWDFGDGNTAEGPEVTHQYDEGGSYNVCLSVTDNSPANPETDVSCIEINTPEYTYFGGQVFAGDFPINNPAPTGDTAIAYLYRVFEDMIVALDTTLVYNQAGLYDFNFLHSGEYMVKVRLTENSARHDEFFPTYYPSILNWQNSQVVTAYEPVFTANIHLVATQPPFPGIGTISGTVQMVDRFGDSPDTGLNGIEVLLLDENKAPLTFALTDENGVFEFRDLPFGSYFLAGDHTGWIISTTQASITESSINASGIILNMAFDETYGVEENIIIENTISIYPNPASGFIRVGIGADLKAPFDLLISDLLGRVIEERKSLTLRNNETVLIPIGHFSSGAYLLGIEVAGKAIQPVKFFVK